MSKTYEDGLKEAWEYAGKIISADKCDEEMNEAFGDDFYYEGAMKVLTKYSIEEVVEKLKEYEIKIGDEVVDSIGKKSVVVRVHGEYITVVEGDGTAIRREGEFFKKTGRHFPQIEEVLKQMQEGEE